jgi:RNA polymerase sigma factor (sigma-70 family)
MQTPSRPTRELFDQCARSPESAAWPELVARYEPCIAQGVRQALRRYELPADPDHVADLVQDTFCRLLERDRRRLKSFQGTAEAQADAWMRRLAERNALDRLRATRRHRSPARARRSRPAPDGGLLQGRRPHDSPEQRVLQRERLRQFLVRCRTLGRGERNARILRMVLVEGWSSREVSAASRGTLTPGTVDTIVYRFRRRLARADLPVPLRGR